ncbi:MSP domain-containing protein [Aphelenchoides fujianensis]|nr:MSP domain-containing protein [Aphelenchoides fujianensis]
MLAQSTRKTALLIPPPKSSNNEHYRVKPAHALRLPRGTTTVELIRLPGPPKEDKLVVQWAEVPAEEEDPQAPFKAAPRPAKSSCR